MAKKKVIHWTKLPRPKLISMIRKLELQCAKLKTQVAENRELRLLNANRIPRMRGAPEAEHALAEKLGVDVPDVTLTLDEALALERGAPDLSDRPRMPWETE